MITYDKNTTRVSIQRLKSSIDNAVITDASGYFSVYDSTGTVVTGLSAIPMIYNATASIYSGVIPATVSLSDNEYELIVTLQDLAGNVGTWTETLYPRKRSR